MNILRSMRRLVGRNSVGRESFVVVSAVRPSGISAQESAELREIFNNSNPEGWWFLNPGTFEAFFLASRSTHAAALASSLRQFPSLGIGVAKGALICELLPSGKLAHLPLGGAITQSLKAAHAEVA